MVFCSQCGSAVNGPFCSSCGALVQGAQPPQTQPYGYPAPYPQQQPPVMGQPLAAQTVQVQPAVPAEAYDCIVCEHRKMAFDNEGAYKNSMKRKVSEGNTEERCDECFNLMQSGTEYFDCEVKVGIGGTKHNRKPILCKRRVCRGCVNMSRHLREHSRWHHKDPEWKASLLCCDGHPCLTLWSLLSFYHVGFGAFQEPKLGDPQPDAGEDSCCFVMCFGIFGLLFLPQVIVLDILGFTVCIIQSHEEKLQQRFGVQPKSCAEIFFCRWCALARTRKEAALRGYLQPVPCCGPTYQERLNAIPGPQPGEPRTGNVFNAPPVAAPAPPPLMGYQPPAQPLGYNPPPAASGSAQPPKNQPPLF